MSRWGFSSFACRQGGLASSSQQSTMQWLSSSSDRQWQEQDSLARFRLGSLAGAQDCAENAWGQLLVHAQVVVSRPECYLCRQQSVGCQQRLFTRAGEQSRAVSQLLRPALKPCPQNWGKWPPTCEHGASCLQAGHLVCCALSSALK